MRWLLRVEEGRLGFDEYYLERFPVTIGRRPDNDIIIPEPAVSRYHGQIILLGGLLRLVDLGSQNGLTVNGERVTSADLKDGDVIGIGPTQLRFAEAARPADEPSVGDTTVHARPPETVEIDPAQTAYLSPHSGPDRTARDLRTLLDLARDVHLERAPESVQRRLLTALFDVVPAERGAIVLRRPGSNLTNTVTLGRVRGSSDVQLSRSTLNQVIDEGRAFLRNRIQRDPSAVARSLVAAEAQAALAAPIADGGEIIGAVYMDTTRDDEPFDRRHLDIAAAAGAVCAGAIAGALREQRVRRGAQALREASGQMEDLYAFDPSMRQAIELIGRAARSVAPVLIQGPLGAGRRKTAEAIHYRSELEDGPFVVLNCAGRKPEMVDQELWGSAEPGKLEQASGGSIYIREVQDLPPGSQARLVSLIDDVALPARVIASTSADVRQAVRQGLFREDLLHRLMTHAVELPALKDRGGEQLRLAERFAERAAARNGRMWSKFSSAATAAIQAYEWPGNVRELRNAIERAESVRDGDTIEIEDLPEAIAEMAAPEGYHERVLEAKRNIVLSTLEREEWSVPKAAAALGINRTYLHRLIRNLDLRQD